MKHPGSIGTTAAALTLAAGLLGFAPAAAKPGNADVPAPEASAPIPDTPAGSLLIQGGTVVDGSGSPRRRADVRIEGGRITALGRLKRGTGERVLDARGLVVAPGFIDAHSHADGGLLKDPLAETQIRQGITTSVVGQDGSSNFPLRKFFSDVEGTKVAINIASFVGQGTVHLQVTGKDYKRPVTADEMQRMRALVAQEMEAGGLGVSTGLEYDPGFYSSTDELIQLSKVAGAYGGMYISHVRDEGDKVFPSFRELERIAREAHVPGQISHIKLDTKPVWGKAQEAIHLMADARQHGVDLSADVYPYTYWQSTIIVLIPTRDWSNRAAWAKGLAEVGGPSHILMSSYTPDAAWSGKTIQEISTMTGKDPITVIQEIVSHTHGPGATGHESVVVTAMTEDDLRRFIKAPRIMFSTDGGLHPSHPRGAGSYPRILGRYVREAHILTLEAAIHKMTGLPAWRMGFHDRGMIAPGKKADLVLFNPTTVLDNATTKQPMAAPTGIPDVLVNGVLVVQNGQLTGARPGEVIRKSAK